MGAPAASTCSQTATCVELRFLEIHGCLAEALTLSHGMLQWVNTEGARKITLTFLPSAIRFWWKLLIVCTQSEVRRQESPWKPSTEVSFLGQSRAESGHTESVVADREDGVYICVACWDRQGTHLCK